MNTQEKKRKKVEKKEKGKTKYYIAESTIEISSNLEGKIRYLCSRFPDKEWSGTLFYEAKGSLAEGFQLKALDLCLLDIGLGAFTSFKDTADIANYQAMHPELLKTNVFEGLIHSHNNMDAFFSGTDVSTLDKEGGYSNHFLSLIVNNAGEYVARLTFKIQGNRKEKVVTTRVDDTFYESYNGTTFALEKDRETQEVKEREYVLNEVHYIDLDITMPERDDALLSELSRRADRLLKEQRKHKFAYPAPFHPNHGDYWDGWDSAYGTWQQKGLFDDAYDMAYSKKFKGAGKWSAFDVGTFALYRILSGNLFMKTSNVNGDLIWEAGENLRARLDRRWDGDVEKYFDSIAPFTWNYTLEENGIDTEDSPKVLGLLWNRETNECKVCDTSATIRRLMSILYKETTEIAPF